MCVCSRCAHCVVSSHLQEDASSSGHHIKYVSHTFSGGADCVLTGAPRTAEVGDLELDMFGG